MMSFLDFKQYVLSLSPVVFIAPVNGNHNTLDSYGRVVSQTGTTVWRPNEKGWGIDPNNAGVVHVADAAEQQITTFTLFIATTKFGIDTGVNEEIAAKSEAAGSQFRLLRSSTNTIILRGAVNREVVVDITGKSTLAVSVVSTEISKLYLDGLFNSNFDGITTITPRSTDINIGAQYNNIKQMQSPILSAIMFPSELTAQQIANIQAAWDRVIVGRGRTETPVWQVKRDLTDPLVHLDFSTIDGKLRDISGNDLHFTNENVTIEQDAPVGNAGTAHTGIRVSAYSADAQLDDIDPISVEFWAKIPTIITLGDRVVSKIQWEVYVINTVGNARIYFRCTRAGGTASWYYALGTVADLSGAPIHVVITYDRGNASANPTLYVNNVTTAWTVPVQQTGAFSSDAANNLALFNYPTSDSGMTGSLADVRIYEKILTPAEVATTLSNLAAGAYTGPFHCITAAHSVGEDSDGRYLQMPSGDVTLRSKFAYGSFYFKAYCKGTVYISFAQTEDADWSNATNDGYMIGFADTNPFYLYRIDNGAATTLANTGTYATDTDYEFFISRDSSNSKFYTWVRGGAYSTWTALHSAVQDATYKTAKFININALGTAGTKVYDIHHYEGFLEPSDVPGLIDV
jgi:hypothetical protein